MNENRTREPETIDAVEQARHFAAHAARALHVLVVAAPPGRNRERDKDLFSLSFGVLTALHSDAEVSTARADAIHVAGLRDKVVLDDDDAVHIMALVVELLGGQTCTGAGPSIGVGATSRREH
jgi:hypothetical protein